MSPSTAFGPWQGPFLSDPAFYDLPLLSRVMARLIRWGPAQNGALILNLLSGAFACLCTGTLSGLITHVVRRAATPWEAACGGLVGGLLFVSSNEAAFAGTAAGPSTLTVFLALSALAAMFFSAESARRSLSWMAGAGLSAGLAASNHPSFGLLLPILVTMLILFDAVPAQRLRRLGWTVAWFGAGATLPACSAWFAGESLQEFLSHALRTPYPTVGDAPPSAGYFRVLAQTFTLPVLGLAVPGFWFLFRTRTRPHVMICLMVFVAFGPLLPFLTNHYRFPNGLQDPVAPNLMVLAMTALAVALGIQAVVGLLIRLTLTPWRRVCAITGIGLILLTFQIPLAPSRHHPYAEQLAQQVLQECPANSILLCGAPDLASLLVTLQESAGLRNDVTAFPVQTLIDPRHRPKLAAALQGQASLDPTFAPEAILSDLGREQPFLVGRLSDGPASELSGENPYLDVAIWDFVRSNFTRRPLCYIGVASTWLTARAQSTGSVMHYPRISDAPSPPLSPLLQELCRQAVSAHDPGLGRTLAQVLLPLSDLARNQDRGPEAAGLAQRVIDLNDKDALPNLSRSRAAARQGLEQEAGKYADAYLRLAATPCDEKALIALIQSDLGRFSLEKQFSEALDQERRQGRPDPLRQTLAPHLWENEQMVALSKGYQSILEQFPNDLDALYEGAAARAQLGDLQGAKEILERWRTTSHVSDGAFRIRFRGDGRFTLLRLSELPPPAPNANAPVSPSK